MGVVEVKVGRNESFDALTQQQSGFQRVGHFLDGWNTFEKRHDVSSEFPAGVTVEGGFRNDTELYACWKKLSFQVSAFSLDETRGSAYVNGKQYDTVEYGDDAEWSAGSRTGYEFHRWNDGIEQNPRTVQVLTAMSLSADFKPSVYGVTLNKDGGTCTDITSYTYGVGATLPDCTKTGYNFNGWCDNAQLTGAYVTRITTTDLGDKTFWAKYTEKEKVWTNKKSQSNLTDYSARGAYVEYCQTGYSGLGHQTSDPSTKDCTVGDKYVWIIQYYTDNNTVTTATVGYKN